MSFFKFGKKGARSKDGGSAMAPPPQHSSAGTGQVRETSQTSITPLQQQQNQPQSTRLQSTAVSPQSKSVPSKQNAKYESNKKGSSPEANFDLPFPADGKKARNLSISRSGRHKERRQRMSVLQTAEVYGDSGSNCRDIDSSKGARPRLAVAGPPTAV